MGKGARGGVRVRVMDKRYMTKGRRVDNGKVVEGYITMHNDIPTMRMPKGTYWRIDPDTIEPIAVAVTKVPVYAKNGKLVFPAVEYYRELCPNCNKSFDAEDGEPNYCDSCGQRLLWSEVE